MDIISHYSAYTPARTSAASRTGTKMPDVGSVSGDGFLNMAKAQGRIGPGAALYNGSATRAKLSDTEIAVLANKYDPHNMDQDTYDAFLDDLQGMGAISELEKRQLGYNGWQLIAYVDKDGKTVHCGSPSGVYHLPDSTDLTMCMIAPWEADTDLHKWLGERTRKELTVVFEPSDPEAAEAYENLLKGLFSIVDRMQTRREENEAATGRPEVGFMTEKMYQEFIQRQLEQGPGSVDRSDTIYNGSTTRTKLSDAEVAALASKYNVHNMSDAEYDALLDDLGSMGALSEREKRLLGQHGVVVIGSIQNGKLVPTGASGGWMAPAGGTALFNRQDANGDIFRWINDRIQWRRGYSSDPEQRKNEKAYDETHEFLAGVINRMAAKQADNAEEARKAELVRQLADRNSDFYTNMRTTLKAQVDKTKEDEEEQAIIDALGAVLDALSGKKDASGHKESVNKSATNLTKKIGEKIARLRQEDPNDPEIVRLENMLKQLQEMGIYIDLSDMDDLWQDEDESFETLTQLLIRRQTEEIRAEHPNEKEVNQSI